MPITIRQILPDLEEDISLACLGDSEWCLPSQIELLESWIFANAQELPTGEYVADVGFCWRRDAAGGGSSLSTELMRRMSASGFSLYLSEYPGFAEEQ
jgi:hypothetical protein